MSAERATRHLLTLISAAALALAGALGLTPTGAAAQANWGDTHCYYGNQPGRRLDFPLPGGYSLELRRSTDPDDRDGRECTAVVRHADGSVAWTATGWGAGLEPWTGHDVDGDGHDDAVVTIDTGGGNRCCWIAHVLRLGRDSLAADGIGVLTFFREDEEGRTVVWNLVPFYDLGFFNADAPVVRLASQYRDGRLVDITAERCPSILSGEARDFTTSREDLDRATPEMRAAARVGPDTAWTVMRTRAAVASLALQHLACGAVDRARALVEEVWPQAEAEQRWSSLVAAWEKVAARRRGGD